MGNNIKVIVRFLLLGLILSLVSLPAFSQQRTKARLEAVAVVGNKTINERLIKFQSGLSEGTTVSGDDIQNGIKTLWELGFFSDIQIKLDKESGENISITILVEEYPRLEKIQLNGNKKLKKKELEKNIEFYKGLTVSPSKMAKWRRKLKEFYREKGYLLATIDVVDFESPTDSSKAVVRFDIKEGNKVQVQKIRFHGNYTFKDKKLRKQMKETKEDTWYRGADFDPDKYREDKDLVLEFYRSEGYREAEILRDSLYYGPEKKDMFVDIWVDEGRKFYFGDVTFKGNELYTSEQLAQVVNFKRGDGYSSKKLTEAFSEKLGTLYWDAGYIWSRIVPKETEVGKDTIDIDFQIEEGKVAKVNKINIVGNSRTKDKVIRRELFMLPGQTFSREMLMRSARELWVLNYFANVNPQPIPTADNEGIDILLEVEEKSTDTANMSAGWSERDKIIGSLGVAMNNLFGNGQKLGFDWNFGRYFRSFQLNFTEPWLFDTPTLAGMSIYDTKRDSRFIGYKQRSRGGSIRVGRRLRWPDNFFRGDWIYRIDQTELSDFNSYILQNNQSIVNEDWPQTASSITQIFSRNSLNRAEFPTIGSNFSISSEIAGSILGGNMNYHKHQLKTEWYSPFIASLVVRSNFELGVIQGFGNGRIPYLERFFMGGEGQSRAIPLRGYDDPLSNFNVGEGGNVMMKYSFELRLPISPNPTIYALAFGEAGNAWNTFKQADFTDLRRSVGFGARVFMPMLGMLGFDYAYGFDNVDRATNVRSGKWKPHFVFGKSF